MKDCTVADVVAISCREGFLFVRVGTRQDDEYDLFYDTSFFYHNYFVDCYVREEEFGKGFHTLALNGEGRCLVDGMELYYHDQGHDWDKGFFSSEPALDDYPGTSVGNFDREDKQYDYQTETRQEKENRGLLVKAINAKVGIPYPIFYVREYQKGDMIYGVCNVFEKYISARPDEPEDVVKAFFYKIDPSKDELTILAQKDSCIAMIVSDSVAVYQREDEIVQQDLSSGEEKTLYHIENTNYLIININENFMQVIEKEKRFLPFLFPAGEKTPILVRWNS